MNPIKTVDYNSKVTCILNNLNEENVFTKFNKLLKLAPKMTELDTQGKENPLVLNSANIKFLTNNFSAFTKLESLTIHGKYDQKFDDEGAQAVAQLIRKTKCLSVVNFNHHNVTSKGVARIAKALYKNKTVEELRLKDNKIDGDGANSLAEMLYKNKKLSLLSLSGNTLVGPSYGTGALAEACKVNKILKRLDLSRCEIDNDGVDAIISMLEENRTLEGLCLIDNPLRDRIVDLVEALKTHPSMKDLNINACDIGNKGAKAVAELIETDSPLETLYLNVNGIGNNGAKRLAKSLSYNSHLKALHLNG
ncbi:MAG: hypothetical protein K940chlam3_00588, partial [Chlamydiae bacterium]|nr:hypothetical protein [Chlamydiota bacterium]